MTGRAKKNGLTNNRGAPPVMPPQRRRRKKPSLLRSWSKRLAALLLLVATLPLVLTLIYAVPGVKPVSTLMLARWLTLQNAERQWMDIDRLSPLLVHSVLMSEDGQFCAHRGIDWAEFEKVVVAALDGERTRGASTIPMQTVKNLYLWSGRSYFRKALELPLALYIDLVLSKRRIMEIYLNVVEWDVGVFGANAASWHYFGKSAANLTRREAALLTVTLPNPHVRNPAKPSRLVSRLGRIIEKRASRSGGYIGCLAAPG